MDPLEPGHCDALTGECLKCVGHAAGPRCERCQEGYFGDAVVAKDCRGKSGPRNPPRVSGHGPKRLHVRFAVFAPLPVPLDQMPRIPSGLACAD